MPARSHTNVIGLTNFNDGFLLRAQMHAEIKFQDKAFSENFWYGFFIDFLFVIPPTVLGVFFPDVDSERHPYWAVMFYILVIIYLGLFIGMAYTKNFMQRKTNQSNIDQINAHLVTVSELLADFRCALVSLRKLTNQAASHATSESLQHIEKLASQPATYAFLIEEILKEVFWIVAKGNRDLNIHITVGFLAARDNRLVLEGYVNSDMSPSSNTKGFDKGEGCAGLCWSDENIILMPNIDANATRGFVASNSRHRKIKSIACLPIMYTNKETHESEFIGVLSLDSDTADYFREEYKESLRTKLEPFVALLRCLYRLRTISGYDQNKTLSGSL